MACARSTQAAPPEFGYGYGVCNGYLPRRGSTYDRFLWALRYIAAQGMVIVLDDHVQYSNTARARAAACGSCRGRAHASIGGVVAPGESYVHA